MRKIDLTKNHRRSIGVSLLIVEELLQEIDYILNHPTNGILSKMTIDVSTQNINSSIIAIDKARVLIDELAVKYNLSVRDSKMSRFIDSRKSKIWEILCDTNSKKLGSYGKFPLEHSTEFDNDINTLLEVINKIEM